MESEDKYSIIGEALPQIIHDIRNSLNAIIGFSSILNMEESLDEETKLYIGSIYDSGNQIEDLLEAIDIF